MRRAVVIVSLALGASAVGASTASAASCGSLRNPFAGTRFSAEAVSAVRASGGVSCSTARGIARKATYRGLIMGKTAGGRKRFSIEGYRVRGDLGSTPGRYTATNGKRRITWTS